MVSSVGEASWDFCQLVSGSSANGKLWQKPEEEEAEAKAFLCLQASGGVSTRSSLSTEICALMQLRLPPQSLLKSGGDGSALPIFAMTGCCLSVPCPPLILHPSTLVVGFAVIFTGGTEIHRPDRRNPVIEAHSGRSRTDHPGQDHSRLDCRLYGCKRGKGFKVLRASWGLGILNNCTTQGKKAAPWVLGILKPPGLG